MAGALLLTAQVTVAQTTVDDFRRQLSQNMDEKADPKLIFMLAIGLVGLFLLVMFLKTRTKRLATARAMNHSGKLLKSVAKELKLKSNEVKQLRLLSEGQGVENPLVLLLCPSLLAKALKANAQKVDRQVIGGLAKRVLTERTTKGAANQGGHTIGEGSGGPAAQAA